MSRRAAGVLLASGLLALCSCGGGNDVAAPAPVGQDLCTLYNGFQVWSFTAKSGTPVPPAQYELFYRGLVGGAAQLAQAKPELRGSLDIVVNGDLAMATGKPIPPPDPGQPTFQTADATITGYQNQACPVAR